MHDGMDLLELFFLTKVMSVMTHSSATIDAVNAAAGAVTSFLLSCHRQARCRGLPLMITGAGVSTASGIPDYRGARGLYHRGHRPMTYQEFVQPPLQRRYMARSFIGYRTLLAAQPNSAHLAISELYHRNIIGHVVTQNVDGLHSAALAEITGEQQPLRAAFSDDKVKLAIPDSFTSEQQRALFNDNYRDMCISEHVTELHGNLHTVVCLMCGDVSCRRQLQKRLAEHNQQLFKELDIQLDYTLFDGCPVATVLEPSEDDRPLARTSSGESHEGEDPLTSTSSKPQSTLTRNRATMNMKQHDSIRPDGDAEVAQVMMDRMVTVPCQRCGAENALKPDVVFFGESVPKERVQSVFQGVTNSTSRLLEIAWILMRTWQEFQRSSAVEPVWQFIVRSAS